MVKFKKSSYSFTKRGPLFCTHPVELILVFFMVIKRNKYYHFIFHILEKHSSFPLDGITPGIAVTLKKEGITFIKKLQKRILLCTITFDLEVKRARLVPLYDFILMQQSNHCAMKLSVALLKDPL